MYILAIETTGAFASVALWKSGRVLSQIQGHDRFSHLQNLTPQIEQVLKEATSSIGDVDAIAVSRGPGSFTGIRIGVSTARALSQITGLPCVPVSSMEALAMRAEAGEDTLVCPILDARRSQVYGGGYFIRDGFPVEEIKAGPYTIEEFMELVTRYDSVYFMGDGMDAYGGRIQEIRNDGVAFAREEVRYQLAETVAKLAEKLAAEGKTCSFENLQPDYMRLAEAERKLKEKQNG